MSNIILKRVYYAVDVELASPLNVSSGMNENTDSDLLKNRDGECFIPGTSIAGALRTRLAGEDKANITGYTSENSGKMSSLFVSDLYFTNKTTNSVRDGVKLSSGKTVENKFDMEILETGAKGTIYLNYIIREKDGDRENLIKVLITDIEKGYIRFGSNKNRGFGRMKVLKVYRQEFSRDGLNKLLVFDAKNKNQYEEKSDYGTWAEKVADQSDDYVKIKVPLKLTGGISIRKYSTRPLEADFEQITINIKDQKGNLIPVVPGTSWNGAIRSAAFSILKDFGEDEESVRKHIDRWFGYVDMNRKTSKQSLVVFSESKISNSIPLKMTRNKVNRFDASTVDGALYTEKAYFGGETLLEIMVKKSVEYHSEALIGLLNMVIKDIQNGYIAIGGQTAVGRGIFEADSSRKTEYINAESEECYSEALYKFVTEGK